MKLSKVMAMLFLGAITVVFADQVQLKDGSVVFGKVGLSTGGKIKVTTDFAGEIDIDASKVESITTEQSLNVAVADEKMSGKIEKNAICGREIALSELKAIWPEGAQDPTLPKGRMWKYQATMDISGETGNSEKASQGAGFKATLAGPIDTLQLYIRGKHTRDNHATTDKEVVAGVDYERKMENTKHSWYVRSEYEYDRIDDLDPSVTSAAGYGHYFIDKDTLKIRGRLGLSHIYKDYVSDRDTDSSIGMDANYHHEIKIQKLLGFEDIGTLLTDVTYTPSFDEFDDYRVYHESSLSIPLGGSKYWKLRLGVSNDYYSRVSKDKKHLDTTYFAKLVLDFE